MYKNIIYLTLGYALRSREREREERKKLVKIDLSKQFLAWVVMRCSQGVKRIYDYNDVRRIRFR